MGSAISNTIGGAANYLKKLFCHAPFVSMDYGFLTRPC